MQECTLRVAGCKPVYQPGVCCPIKYNCEYDEEPSTTVGPTPGLIMTTTLPPGVPLQCYHEGNIYEDGDQIIVATQPCQHCYCFGGEIACAVQNCGTPMQAHGKNCTAKPPPEGECCPTTYQCEEEITTEREGEEQTSEVLLGQTTEFPMLIEDQQQKDEHPQEAISPGIDSITPRVQDEKDVEGAMEHITQQYVPSTEKSEEHLATLPEEIETTTFEKESTAHEHITETSPPEITSEEAKEAEVPSEAGISEIPTTVGESLVTKTPVAELPEVSSIAPGLQPEEMLPTEHVSTEKDIIEEEHTLATTEKGQSIEPAISEATQTEGPIKEEETTSPHEELSTQTQEEVTEIEKTTEEAHISVTKEEERPTEEEPGISTVSESVSEPSKIDEGNLETIPGEPLATETESPKEEETVTIAHNISSTEQIATEKEMLYPMVTAVTEEAQPTEVSAPSEKPVEEQKPVASEETTSEHAIIEEQATVGAKKEDAGLTEMSEEPVITTELHAEEVSTPEIPPLGPTGIPIPERSPEQKAEDSGMYHLTEDYPGVTRPEIGSDNLVTEPPQKIPTTYFPQEQETTLIPKETVKPIATEGAEESVEGTTKSMPEEITEINLPTQHKPEITTISEEMKTESTPTITEVQLSTESSVTAQEVSEKETLEISTEKGSVEKGEKEVQPKKEEEIEAQPPIAMKPETIFETSTPIPAEHTTEGEHITTIISSVEQSTHVPQVKEKETEIVPSEKEEPITEKPVEEHITAYPITIPSITGEEEKELQTKESVLKEEQTTETIKTIEEAEDKFTTREPSVEDEITVQPEHYSTEKESAVTESHILEETEATKGSSTESAEQQTAMTEKELSEKTMELKPTEVSSVDQTELPVEHPIETGEENISVPVSTEEIQTETPIETIETTSVETEKIQTEPSVSGEHIPSQPPIPSDRKEDQGPIEPEVHEEQITQEPEKEITETYEEPQKPTIPVEEETSHIPSAESVTESVLPEEEPTKGTTESIGVDEAITSEQPEILSEQPEKVTTEPSKEEEQTKESITEEQPEISTPATHEEPSITHIPEGPVEGEEDLGISKPTETAESEGTTISVLVSEASTELPEQSTKHEVSIEKEITPATESVSSEKEQPGLQEQTTQLSKEETPIKEKDETEILTEISTEEGIISEIPKIPITEQPQESEEGQLIQRVGTEIPSHEEKEKYSTIAPKETPEVIITTEISPVEVTQHITTSIPEETSVEEETTSEIVPRPSGIPGEGNCLVEGQSYSNNSAVPPANICQTSCRCISSIVQCELVQCLAPPEPTCMPVHMNKESCCPMYACDSTQTTNLESDSHLIEPDIRGAEEESQKTTEISTEVATELSTLAGEISTPESQPAEITVPSVTLSQEEIATERQQTTIKPVILDEQTTTVGQPIEQYPEKHTISPVPETSQESTSQIPEEEHTVSSIGPGETTEGHVSEENITELAASTEQPQKEIEESSVSSEVITSTHIPTEQESHSTEEIVTLSAVTEEKETSVPVEVEETSKPAEEEVTTIAAKDEETITSTKEPEKHIDEKGIEEPSALKPIEEIEKKPEEEEVSLKPTSEEPITTEEISTEPEEIVTEKQEIPEEHKTIKPTEYESTSVPEIQSTTEHKFESETVQTEEPVSQTKLPDIALGETETQEPIISIAESTTFIHDHTHSEEPVIREFTTIKSAETSTEETTKIESEILTQGPATEKEHVISVEEEMPAEETTKVVEESTPEVSSEETLPETTESTEKETTEYVEKHTEASVTEHEEEPLATKLPEEKPFETESSISTEEPTKTVEADKTTATEAEYEKPTESSEKYPEVTPEIESHTSELPAEEHTIAEVVPTTSVSTEEAGEQHTTPIVKETEPSLIETETKQSIIPETETPEHVTVQIDEQTPKSEYPVEEQTVTSSSLSEEEIKEGGVSTEAIIPTTSQEEQTTEHVKPETQVPGLAEEHTVIPEIYKKDEEQKPEIEITEEPVKEEPTTEAGKKETEEAASTTEEHIQQEEIGIDVKIQGPMETTTISKEQKPEEEGQITEASLPEHPVSEEATTVTSLTSEEHPTVPVKTEEKESTDKPEYQTTLSSAEEEVSKPATEISEVEKHPPEEEIVTAESTEKPEEPVTKLEVSSTEKPQKIPSETEESTKLEQETELPEQDETTMKAIESAVTKEILPEEVIPVEVTPKAEEKPIETSTAGEAEEAYSTEPTYSVEVTSVHEEEQPSITVQPTERPLPSEEETPAGETQPSQSEEDEEAHPTVSKESHPEVTEESQFTTEHASETPITIKTEVEGPIKVSSVKPTELPEATVGPITPEEPESQIPLKSEESPQPETPEEPVIKMQTPATELPTGEVTEEILEEEPIHPQVEGHIDHLPAATVKPEIDYNFPEQRPVTTLAPHIPEYPDQPGIPNGDAQFPMPYPNPDDDYGEDDYGGPGTCRYGGKVYVSAQQIPRDDPCDFCFCFRSDIICLQQSCPPPIPGCHEEPISGFCCPRYECPVSMASALNLTTTTTTTTTTLPPHFPAHAYKGAVRRSGCQVRGQAYRVGEVIKSASGPCLRCICGGDGNMNCDPRVCSPEPMLRQMIAATTDAKRRR